MPGQFWWADDRARVLVEVYRDILTRRLRRNPTLLDSLRGKDLACWCRLDQPCHADVLLELANQDDEGAMPDPAHARSTEVACDRE